MVWGSLGLTMAAIVAAFIVQKARDARQPADLIQSTDAPSRPGGPLPVLFHVPDFALTNQTSRTVTRSDLRGQAWLADIIFTRCAGPCPDMTRRMADLQAAIPTNQPVTFVTLTTDPEHDSPAVLRTYSDRFGAKHERWHFLTGTKKQIADLAGRGLKLTALEKQKEQQENPDDLFIHSTLFVLVDQQGRARAVFESDDAGMKPKALRAIAQLLHER